MTQVLLCGGFVVLESVSQNILNLNKEKVYLIINAMKNRGYLNLVLSKVT